MTPNAPGITYLGRPCAGWIGSPLANPYHIGKDGDRVQVIRKYKVWLWTVMQAKNSDAWDELKRLVDAPEPLTLGCWCLPQPCHIEVVKAAILYLRRQEAGNLT